LEPARGRVTWGGRDILDLPALERARLVAYLAQGETWHWPLSVEEVVLLGRHPHRRPFVAPTAEDRAAVARALAATATADFATRRIDTLSGGERRRVLLARALAVEAPFLLADEPVSGLDPALQHQTMTGLRIAAGRGVGVAVVLHDLHLAAHYCDHILVIAAGKVVAMGPPDQALADGILRRVYGLGALRVPVEGGAVPLPWPGGV
ncbi:MAG: ABC transporter ATP-binding protein, partial [Alphaproteobacteria bacterium]|nr:ABC transporter ATP-binding protein [Alphaproteobacteria bacterium]